MTTLSETSPPPSSRPLAKLRVVKRLALFLVALLLSLELALRAAGWALDDARAQSPTGDAVILCAGDSFIFGSGAPRSESFPVHLQARCRREGLDFQVVNEGRPGTNSALLAARTPELLKKYRPRIMVILTGANNSWNRSGMSEFRHAGGARTNAGLHDFLVEHSRVYKALVYAFTGPDLAPPLPAELPAPDQGTPWLPPRPSWADKALWEAMSERRLRAKPYLDQGDREGARAVLRAVLDEEPRDYISATWIGNLLLEDGRYGEAEPMFERALGLEPTDAVAMWGLADVRLGAHRDEEARDLFRRSFELRRNTGPFLMKWRETFRGDEQALQQALREYRARLIDDPRFGRGFVETIFDEAMRQEGRDDGAGRDLAADFAAIAGAAHGQGVRLLVLTYPGVKKKSVILGAAGAHELPVLTLDDKFAALLSDAPRERYFVGDGHCNGLGYRHMADFVFEDMKARGWLTAAAPPTQR